jgi:hypothetical protein
VHDRLTFERQLADLETEQAKPVCKIDFYDQVDPHLNYLGRFVVDAAQARWELRLVNPATLKGIFDANRLPVQATSSNYAISLPGRQLEDTLYPESKGLYFSKPRFDYARIDRQVRASGQSLWVNVRARKDQQATFDGLLRAAKRDNKEQGVYIVIEPKHTQDTADLYFLAARPLSSSSTDFSFSLGVQTSGGKKMVYPTTNRGERRQVIGTVHTHYVKPGGSQRAAPQVSPLDVNSAKDNEFVVYAIEEKQWHKATPAGKAINGLKPDFNLLVDALETFAGKRPLTSGAS